MPTPTPQPMPDRLRVSLDLTPPLVLLLDHVSGITGIPRTALITQALLEALPAHMERLQRLTAGAHAALDAARKAEQATAKLQGRK